MASQSGCIQKLPAPGAFNDHFDYNPKDTIFYIDTKSLPTSTTRAVPVWTWK